MRFAKRCLHERNIGVIDTAAGEADLAGMAGEMFAAFGEEHARRIARDDRHQNGRSLERTRLRRAHGGIKIEIAARGRERERRGFLQQGGAQRFCFAEREFGDQMMGRRFVDVHSGLPIAKNAPSLQTPRRSPASSGTAISAS